MNKKLKGICGTLALTAFTAGALAHISPPVTHVSDRDAITRMTAGASRHFVRELRLKPEQRRVLQQRTGWNADASAYQFFVARDDRGAMVSAVTFLAETTLHGPLRVAVALDPTGRVKDALIVESTEEVATWVRALNQEHFARNFVGLDGRDKFEGRAAPAAGGNMVEFYRKVAVGLIQRAAALYDVGALQPQESEPPAKP